MKLLIGLILILPISITAQCIDTNSDTFMLQQSGAQTIKQLVTVRYLHHTLFYNQESCGAQGCELFIISKISPSCNKLTLNTKGFYLPHSLQAKKVKIKVAGKEHTFFFNQVTQRFQ